MIYLMIGLSPCLLSFFSIWKFFCGSVNSKSMCSEMYHCTQNERKQIHIPNVLLFKRNVVGYFFDICIYKNRQSFSLIFGFRYDSKYVRLLVSLLFLTWQKLQHVPTTNQMHDASKYLLYRLKFLSSVLSINFRKFKNNLSTENFSTKPQNNQFNKIWNDFFSNQRFRKKRFLYFSIKSKYWILG